MNQYNIAHQYWHSTLNQLGVSSIPDSLAGSNVGAWNMLASLDPHRQERSYSASAYYEPIAGRPNLHLLTEAIVMEVLFDTDERGCLVTTAVRVQRELEEVDIKVIREVILSAGSVQSPQLLELSGIGNRDVLEAAGIPVKIHNPNVGENLQEHMSTDPLLLYLESSECI